ncbi:MAG: RNase adapter RapZ [Capsulimonadales bacterium]|nr:RNase adapter RapZ [Capsulimonadales bacterium]
MPTPETVPLVVLTGLSGAGKQLAARHFEDMKWRVVDNLSPALVSLALREREADGTAKPLCVVCDVRCGRIGELGPELDALKGVGLQPILVFLEASDEELIRRFKETRRPHPLFDRHGAIPGAIEEERRLLDSLRERADLMVDTTGLSAFDLRTRLQEALREVGVVSSQPPMAVTVVSFGFKFGVPLDVDLVFDVRFLRNPHYVPTLRPHDGRNPEVEAYVLADERTSCFLERLYDLVGWSLPHYISEGKAYLTIGIGCTGGRHRSVVISEKLGRFLTERGYRSIVRHRDADREPRLPIRAE